MKSRAAILRRSARRGAAFLGAVAAASFVGMIASADRAEADEKADLLKIAQTRQLSTDDMLAAAATYTPTGHKDEFVCLNSGGQAASVIVYAVPSMRILKYIPTGAPDSSAGFSYDVESRGLLNSGAIDGRSISWGDTHHPAFSETDGKYDGRFAFINDKANPRVFVIDLRDFETKQIVPNPIFRSEHGGAFVTPNTEYVIESAQYSAPPDRTYRPMTQANFNKYWRGGITYHKFDRAKGRIDPDKSFTILAPPYIQDLSDAGKGESAGWSFTNSLCSERYVGGIEKGRPPWEAGCSARDMDYMHIVNWKKAAEIVAAGRGTKINGHNVIPMELAAKEGILFLVPEAKSPHGVDVSPDGRYIVVAGKLDTHGQVFDIRKIKKLIEAKDFAGTDPYGIPILDYKKALHGQVQLGLGPLHTQFDSTPGVAYTSVYIDSVVVKWDYVNLKVLTKQSVHYNIGHLVAMQGDSRDPRGKYVVSLNKLAIDRFNPVGPLHPQNHQLIDVSGEKMRLIYDMPLPMGEPHYTVCIDAKTLRTQDVYPVGTDATTMTPSSFATAKGKEKIERSGKTVTVFGTLSRAGGLEPRQLDLGQGDTVSLHITNLETKAGATFKLVVGGYDALGIFAPGETATVKFQATQSGLFPIRWGAVDDPYETRQFGLLSVKPDAAFDRARRRTFASTIAARSRRAAWKVQFKNEKLGPGESEFSQYGCIACHQKGREVGGPDLTDVTVRRNQGWMLRWITGPETMYDDPTIQPLIAKFGVKMPNQGVKPDEAQRIIDYLASWKSAQAPSADVSPEEKVYRKICFACHDQAVGGAPKIGDKEAWGPRLAQDEATLLKHIKEGFQGKAGYMPPRGSCADCSDEDLASALKYIRSRAQ